MRISILVLIALAASLAFAFGGGGGGGGGGSEPPPKPIQYVDQQFSVATNGGQAAPGVDIQLSIPGSDSIFATAVTDSSGKASIRLQSGFQFIAAVSAQGFGPAQKAGSASTDAISIVLQTRAQVRENQSADGNFSVRGRSLPCGGQATMQDRVACRFGVATSNYNQLYYVPEECRAQENATARQNCLELYDGVQSCRRLESQDGRFACVREKLGIQGTARQAIAACKASGNPSGCMMELEEKIFSLAKFKLYNLEERAEYLVSDGLPRQSAVDFVAKMEQLKLDFNAAGTISQKQQLLQAALADWQDFKAQAMLQVREGSG